MPEAVINLDIESLPGGGYVATSHDLPGLVAQGRTIAECTEIAQDVARKLVESYVEHGDPLPPKAWLRKYIITQNRIGYSNKHSLTDGKACRFQICRCRAQAETTRLYLRPPGQGRHEIWWNQVTRARTTIPNHPGDIPEGTLRAILRAAGVDQDQFLNA